MLRWEKWPHSPDLPQIVPYCGHCSSTSPSALLCWLQPQTTPVVYLLPRTGTNCRQLPDYDDQIRTRLTSVTVKVSNSCSIQPLPYCTLFAVDKDQYALWSLFFRSHGLAVRNPCSHDESAFPSVPCAADHFALPWFCNVIPTFSLFASPSGVVLQGQQATNCCYVASRIERCLC